MSAQNENLRQDMAGEISGIAVGSGYESTSIGITAALEAADALIAAGYGKQSEPEITDEMVRAAKQAWLEHPVDRGMFATERRMRAALEAARSAA